MINRRELIIASTLAPFIGASLPIERIQCQGLLTVWDKVEEFYDTLQCNNEGTEFLIYYHKNEKRPYFALPNRVVCKYCLNKTNEWYELNNMSDTSTLVTREVWMKSYEDHPEWHTEENLYPTIGALKDKFQ